MTRTTFQASSSLRWLSSPSTLHRQRAQKRLHYINLREIEQDTYSCWSSIRCVRTLARTHIHARTHAWLYGNVARIPMFPSTCGCHAAVVQHTRMHTSQRFPPEHAREERPLARDPRPCCACRQSTGSTVVSVVASGDESHASYLDKSSFPKTPSGEDVQITHPPILSSFPSPSRVCLDGVPPNTRELEPLG